MGSTPSQEIKETTSIEATESKSENQGEEKPAKQETIQVHCTKRFRHANTHLIFGPINDPKSARTFNCRGQSAVDIASRIKINAPKHNNKFILTSKDTEGKERFLSVNVQETDKITVIWAEGIRDLDGFKDEELIGIPLVMRQSEDIGKVDLLLCNGKCHDWILGKRVMLMYKKSQYT